MRYAHVVVAFAAAVWAMDHRKLTEAANFLRARAMGGAKDPAAAEDIRRANAARWAVRFEALGPAAFDQEQENERRTAAAPPSRGTKAQAGSVAVIPVTGIISQRSSAMDDMSGPGGTSTDRLIATIRACVSDDSVKAIILDCDSPGGTVYGVPEAADFIRESRGKKPIIGQINSLAASACYWLVAQCDEVVITPSGQAGSIGVYQFHQDWSRAMDAAGITETYIYAGQFKVEGNDSEPLSEEAKAAMQKEVDDYYSMFLNGVAAGRGLKVKDVSDNFGKGRVLMAKDAKKVGMVDRIATLDETLERLGAPPRGGAARVEAIPAHTISGGGQDVLAAAGFADDAAADAFCELVAKAAANAFPRDAICAAFDLPAKTVRLSAEDRADMLIPFAELMGKSDDEIVRVLWGRAPGRVLSNLKIGDVAVEAVEGLTISLSPAVSEADAAAAARSAAHRRRARELELLEHD